MGSKDMACFWYDKIASYYNVMIATALEKIFFIMSLYNSTAGTYNTNDKQSTKSILELDLHYNAINIGNCQQDQLILSTNA